MIKLKYFYMTSKYKKANQIQWKLIYLEACELLHTILGLTK